MPIGYVQQSSKKNNQITASIQVTVSMGSNELKPREIAGLIEALSTYQIKMIPIWKWLLS